jgi:hypothetical protein
MPAKRAVAMEAVVGDVALVYVAVAVVLAVVTGLPGVNMSAAMALAGGE